MSAVSKQGSGSRTTNGPPLVPGQRLKQPEFHRRYEAYPDDVKFELIGGVVYLASPLRRPHGGYHAELSLALGHYKAGTPGIELLDNTTTILGEESEPQPDLELRILSAFGGQSWETAEDYVEGPPELVAAISHSTQRLDLGSRRADYEQAGVVEYLVLRIQEQELLWFNFRIGKPIQANRQGIFKSKVFPGLWINGRALWARDSARIIEVVQQGLASREHARFVKRLQAAHRRSS
jgi:hypothetical protein